MNAESSRELTLCLHSYTHYGGVCVNAEYCHEVVRCSAAASKSGFAPDSSQLRRDCASCSTRSQLLQPGTAVTLSPSFLFRSTFTFASSFASRLHRKKSKPCRPRLQSCFTASTVKRRISSPSDGRVRKSVPRVASLMSATMRPVDRRRGWEGDVSDAMANFMRVTRRAW